MRWYLFSSFETGFLFAALAVLKLASNSLLRSSASASLLGLKKGPRHCHWALSFNLFSILQSIWPF